MYWSASGQFFARSFFASHSIFRPARRATLPSSTNSVRRPAYSKFDRHMGPPLQASIHSRYGPLGALCSVCSGPLKSLNCSSGSRRKPSGFQSRKTILALEPTIIVPFFGSSLPSARSRLGSLPPSYHVIVTGGIAPRAANSERTMLHFGQVSALTPDDSASTETGASSFSAQYAASALWQPMSPGAPVPKSHQPRQLKGA